MVNVNNLTRWAKEARIFNSVTTCAWDRKFGLTIEGLTSHEADVLVSALHQVSCHLAAEESKPALAPAQPATVSDSETVAVAAEAEQVDVIDQPTTVDDDTVETQETEVGEPPKKRKQWGRHKRFNGIEIRSLKRVGDGGALILLVDGTGVEVDAYGDVTRTLEEEEDMPGAEVEDEDEDEDEETTVEVVEEPSQQPETTEEPSDWLASIAADPKNETSVANTVKSIYKYGRDKLGMKDSALTKLVTESCEKLASDKLTALRTLAISDVRTRVEAISMMMDSGMMS